jgi:hypothetical protein
MQTYLGTQTLAHLGNQAQLTFANDGQTALPRDFWEPHPTNRFVYQCIARSTSAAIDAIYAQGATLECNLAAQLAQYAALRDALGRSKFDRRYRKEPLVLGAPKQYDAIAEEKTVSEQALIVGDVGYAANHWAYSLRHPRGAWKGENCVYQGDDSWVGFGVRAPFDQAAIQAKLAGAYNETPSAADDAWWEDRTAKGAQTWRLSDEVAAAVVEEHRSRSEVPDTVTPELVPGVDARQSAKGEALEKQDDLLLERSLAKASERWSASLERRFEGATKHEVDAERSADEIEDGHVNVNRMRAAQIVEAGGRRR